MRAITDGRLAHADIEAAAARQVHGHDARG
jgi:hypothetical protein